MPHELALAYSLSTIAGLRAAFILLVISAAIHLNLIQPSAPTAWMGSDETLIIAAILTLADFFGDKIPVVDHGLHLVHTALAPASGAIAAMAVGSSDPHTAAILGIAGGANALGVHTVRSVTRVGSSVATFGILTPIISFAEDALAIVSTIVAFAAPAFAAAVACIATIFAFVAGRKIVRSLRNRRIKTVTPQP